MVKSCYFSSRWKRSNHSRSEAILETNYDKEQKQEIQNMKLDAAKCNLNDKQWHAPKLVLKNAASSWSAALPLKRYGFTLTKSEFRTVSRCATVGSQRTYLSIVHPVNPSLLPIPYTAEKEAGYTTWWDMMSNVKLTIPLSLQRLNRERCRDLPRQSQFHDSCNKFIVDVFRTMIRCLNL